MFSDETSLCRALLTPARAKSARAGAPNGARGPFLFVSYGYAAGTRLHHRLTSGRADGAWGFDRTNDFALARIVSSSNLCDTPICCDLWDSKVCHLLHR